MSAALRTATAALAALAVLAATPAASAQTRTGPPLRFDRTVERSGSGFVMDLGPAELSLREQSFGAIVVALPQGMALDTRARKRLCSPEQARNAQCPRASLIGFGHLVVRFTGYLFPGGETHAVAQLYAYLGRPTQTGDAASLVLRVKPLGVKAIRQAVFEQFGRFAPQLNFAWVGRIVRIPSGPHGVEFRIEGMPGGLALPAPLAARVVRVKLAIGAVRRLKRTFYRRFTTTTPSGGKRVRRVKDHHLFPHHLLRNPRRCVGGSWGWELRVVFPDAIQRTVGRQSCKIGKIPISPPRSPSPPQHS
jgi:hypothetical protein